MSFLRPSAVGDAAESLLDESGLVIQSVGSGSYSVTGPVFIHTAKANIQAPPDTYYSWADSTHVKWRFFQIQPGTTYTISLSGRSYVATYNPIIKTVSQSGVTYPQEPQWVAGISAALQQGFATNDSAATRSYTAGNIQMLVPALTWFDLSLQPSGFNPQALWPAQTDVFYDIVYPLALVNASNTTPWVRFNSSGAIVSNQFNMISYSASGPNNWCGMANMNFGSMGGSIGRTPMVFFAVLLTKGITMSTTVWTQVNPVTQAANICNLVLIGPFAPSIAAGEGSTGYTLTIAIPAWANFNANNPAPNGADTLSFGFFAFEGTPTGLSWPMEINMICSSILFGFARQSQLLTGEASRTT